MSNEVLVVVSKLKNYIRSAAEMNTSGNVPPALSGLIRELCEGAIENAKSDGRKTVMDRDFTNVPSAISPVEGSDVLVVVSKLKNYIRSAAEMNTSGNVAPQLSNIIRGICAVAVENAKNDGRKTVMDRDLPSLQAGMQAGEGMQYAANEM